MDNIEITDLEVYHGENVVGNDVFINHFKKQDKDVEHLMKDIMGRNKRYLINKDSENSLTLIFNVVDKILKKTGLCGEDFDMIVLSSNLPEYTSPASSILIHNHIEGKENCICFDLNANCVGMLIGIDNVSSYMKVNSSIKRALIVGCDYLNLEISKDSEMGYGEYGDAACALILEKTNRECGIIDIMNRTISNTIDYIRFPKCGFSNLYKVDEENVKAVWGSGNFPWQSGAIININELLEKNNIKKSDISLCCFSQYSYKMLDTFREGLEFPKEKMIYIGNEYGYTGSSSLFIALYEAKKKKLIKRGDYILFWTIACGIEYTAILLKY